METRLGSPFVPGFDEIPGNVDSDHLRPAAFHFDRHYYKVLLGIREDYLPDLESLRARMPRVAQNRLRLRRMNGEAALLVVNQAQHLIDPDVAEEVVRFVAADRHSELRDLEIEPALLSVFCSELNHKRKDSRQAKITRELLQGSQQQVIANFYERSTRDLAPEVRTFVEDHLLTVSGFRDSVALENALGMGVSEETIKKLVDRRLLRQEDRSGSKRLELTHDLLVSVVRASRDERHRREAAEKEKAELLAAQEKQKRELLEAQERERQERSRKEARLYRIAFTVTSILLLAAVGMAILAYHARQQAEDEKNSALAKVQGAVSELLATERLSSSGTNQTQMPSEKAGTDQTETSMGKGGGPPPPALPTSHNGSGLGQAVSAAATKPRVFIQIVNQNDRGKANDISALLQSQGCSVQGMQFIPQAAALTQSDLRYYRKADTDQAQRIADALKGVGVEVGKPKYLSGYETAPPSAPTPSRCGSPTALAAEPAKPQTSKARCPQWSEGGISCSHPQFAIMDETRRQARLPRRSESH